MAALMQAALNTFAHLVHLHFKDEETESRGVSLIYFDTHLILSAFHFSYAWSSQQLLATEQCTLSTPRSHLTGKSTF